MAHLTERLAEFVFGELSPAEAAEGKRHLMDCSDCRARLHDFQQTYAMLQASPDVEPPRRTIFEVEQPRYAPWIRRWLAPMAASAAVALAVVNLAPRPEPRIVERVVQQQPATPAAVQPVDYERIINELRVSQQAWLAGELKKRDVDMAQEFMRIRGEQDSLYSYQRRSDREKAELQASIQPLLAVRTETRE